MKPLSEPVSDAVLDRLRTRLVERATQESLLDVAYRTVDSPLGGLLLAATERGLVRVAFAAEGEQAVLAELSARVSPRILYAPARLDPAARQLEEYFAHRRESFELPVDLVGVSGFRRLVLDRLPAIGYGRTASYAELAEASGSPRAVRAVGTACARNPLPLVLPCHRVVRSNGTFGSYRGGPEAKAYLLELERG